MLWITTDTSVPAEVPSSRTGVAVTMGGYLNSPLSLKSKVFGGLSAVTGVRV
jgi:hypothetical protein